MKPLLAFSRVVDGISTFCGRVAEWLVLLAAVISAGNAVVRYLFSWSSNGWLEVQWYLFAGVVMLGGAYTLLRNGHVRVDLIYGNMSERGRLWTDVLGILFFLFPAMLLLVWMTWPFFLDSLNRWEGSSNAGGLLRWPAKLLLPVGFLLVFLQGASELIKRIALLRGLRPEGEVALAYEKPMQ
ncbi:TRAP transporter small permease subunit [Roseomonas gilardii]|uniref:TRAP transporter small permease protein n=1 Tax=Roseomonas gilardii TaxID=257708 RepID=A0A1L7ACU8_9PROT|nr:TRAP transporter small permease subunit [Roseomonas gilardii]APT56540.1 sugar transporter [Roseomonas gilardii]MDT8331224.1 TRAP transporter small permease subunit [Roseomonas gilardii]PZR15722.1 MAG: sugar transporter [Azospirillum brasilense]